MLSEPTPQNYREEAARLRYEATKMTHRENRQRLLDIAALYDWLAKVMERLLQSNLTHYRRMHASCV